MSDPGSRIVVIRLRQRSLRDAMMRAFAARTIAMVARGGIPDASRDAPTAWIGDRWAIRGGPGERANRIEP